ncbi:hypothetical protein FOCC_FOCC013951 [Frankliniella occidentalis]|nr:hypothetical protein FOCC_FOCC013951 [Frankliniella occidentalis]
MHGQQPSLCDYDCHNFQSLEQYIWICLLPNGQQVDLGNLHIVRRVHEDVQLNNSAAQLRNKEYYDAAGTNNPIRCGQTVWLYSRRRKGRCPKLDSPWVGPFQVVSLLTDITARIRPLFESGRRKPKLLTVHVDRLANKDRGIQSAPSFNLKASKGLQGLQAPGTPGVESHSLAGLSRTTLGAKYKKCFDITIFWLVYESLQRTCSKSDRYHVRNTNVLR